MRTCLTAEALGKSVPCCNPGGWFIVALAVASLWCLVSTNCLDFNFE